MKTKGLKKVFFRVPPAPGSLIKVFTKHKDPNTFLDVHGHFFARAVKCEFVLFKKHLPNESGPEEINGRPYLRQIVIAERLENFTDQNAEIDFFLSEKKVKIL